MWHDDGGRRAGTAEGTTRGCGCGWVDGLKRCRGRRERERRILKEYGGDKLIE